MSSKLRPLAPFSFPLVKSDGTPAQPEYAFELDRLVRTLEASPGGVPATRLLTAGTGLTGGGDLSADRTFAVTYGTAAGTAAQGNDARIVGAAQTADLGSAAFVDTTAFDAAGTATAAIAAHVAAADPHPQYLTATEGNAAYQPLDSDLTAIAALTTTTFGRSLLTNAAASDLRTSAGLGTAAIANASALTKTDDTNVTLALGGTPATALLQAASITVGWSGSLAVARGGTGSTTAAGARTNLGVPLQGYLVGLTLSTAGSSGTFSVAAGKAADSTAADLLALASTYTKTTSAWAVGTATGSLDTGTIANSTWYHVHLIKRTDTGVVDVLISLSPTAPTLPTNYTLFRRIGSMLTNASAQWVKFIQDGDRFVWDVPATDATITNPGTTAVLRTLTVPAGINTFASIHARCYLTTAGGAVATIFTDPAQTDTAPDFTNSQQIGNTSLSPFSNIQIRTNTSRQIRIRSNFSDATTNLIVVTDGWIDARGRT